MYSEKDERTTAHARERAYERYGLSLSHTDVVNIVNRLKKYLEGTLSNRRKATIKIIRGDKSFPPTVTAAILFKRTWLPIVYIPLVGRIKTILPPEELT